MKSKYNHEKQAFLNIIKDLERQKDALLLQLKEVEARSKVQEDRFAEFLSV
jgi:hypothetical protein